MYAVFITILSIICLSVFPGCKRVTRGGVLSTELPITVDDISEIRAGEQNHEKVLWQYKIYSNPTLETYVNAIAANIANASVRPNLPYKVFILDEEEINIFGGPGGYIYITRGMLQFIQSESELAGVLAHEIGHIANYDYLTVPHQSKVKLIYTGLLQGSELAKGAIGTYGTAANLGLKGVGRAAPIIAQQFGKDAEIVSDKNTIDFMVNAGYDPRAYLGFLERLSRVPMADVWLFVNLLSNHPPFPGRRELLQEKIKDYHLEEGDIEFKQDTLSEVRQQLIAGTDPGSSIRFEPGVGVRHLDAVGVNDLQQDKQEKVSPAHKRFDWL